MNYVGNFLIRNNLTEKQLMKLIRWKDKTKLLKIKDLEK